MRACVRVLGTKGELKENKHTGARLFFFSSLPCTCFAQAWPSFLCVPPRGAKPVGPRKTPFSATVSTTLHRSSKRARDPFAMLDLLPMPP